MSKEGQDDRRWEISHLARIIHRGDAEFAENGWGNEVVNETRIARTAHVAQLTDRFLVVFSAFSAPPR